MHAMHWHVSTIGKLTSHTTLAKLATSIKSAIASMCRSLLVYVDIFCRLPHFQLESTLDSSCFTGLPLMRCAFPPFLHFVMHTCYSHFCKICVCMRNRGKAVEWVGGWVAREKLQIKSFMCISTSRFRMNVALLIWEVL